MNIDKALEMSENKEFNRDAKNEVYEGLKIIAKYEKDMDFNVGHDQCWAGKDELIEKMTEEDVKAMLSLNWFIDEDDYSWSKFV